MNKSTKMHEHTSNHTKITTKHENYENTNKYLKT